MHSKIIDELAASSGVAAADVTKVLNALGKDAVVAELEKSVGKDRVSTLKAGDLKLAVRLGRSSVAV